MSSRNNVVISKKKLSSNKNEASHQMALGSKIILHFPIRCKYLIFMNGNLISAFKKISKIRGEEIFIGYQKFFLATNFFFLIPGALSRSSNVGSPVCLKHLKFLLNYDLYHKAFIFEAQYRV